MAFASFVAGVAAFVWFFYLARKLGKERTGPPMSRLQNWFPWLPGEFSATGEKMRRQMNILLAVGWVFLILGLVLSPR